ncbi:hydroxyectoine utilization dehydratase EutB [Bacillus capparidis]|uniref:Threonine dehydratase n=1 Tax=Bacillus capparidis TaxID=1840411 RepID=A0ABS4D2K8_9BACI|nr:hydroxyectoine utilization dehydratase EutB [Bacillus capparidis]MBP1083838.1 threonine dehydratase [Bacillus capparidis]MED1098321.1 hydroxyectoine utilization dehydratase EutB [Bacillus capparidis]
MTTIQQKKETLISVQDVWKAKQAIGSIIQKTPLVHSPALSNEHTNVYIKYEHLHDSGAFKMRGAVNAMLHLSEKQRSLGVTTFSTGNHGAAVALAAKKLGIRSCICVSKRVPQAKLEAIKKLGAELEISGDGQDDAEARCYELERKKGLTVIPPFDHPHVIAGQGTIALELLEDLPQVDCVIGGLSGGGLLSGIGMVMKHTNPSIEIIGLSMEKGAAMHKSLKSGQAVTVAEHPTLADSLLGGIGKNNQYTFNMAKRYVDRSLLIPEDSIAKGMAYLYKHHHIIIEGAAAIAAGALLDRLIEPSCSEIVLISSGCNVDLQTHAKAIQPYL